MCEQPLSQPAKAVFGSDPDRREVRSIVLIYHHERKSDHLLSRSDHSIADRPGLVEQIIERMFRIVIAVAKTADVKPQHLGQLIQRQRPDRIVRRRSRHNDLSLSDKAGEEKAAYCIQKSHSLFELRSYGVIKSPVFNSVTPVTQQLSLNY